MSDGDAATEIMCATYRALCSHGYADLTMQDIADESSKSKAALHYHYDSKHDLLCAFLDYLYDRFVERTADVAGEDAHERLLGLVEAVLTEREDREAFETAILEIRAQAPYDAGFRDRLTRFEDHLVAELTAILEAGVEAGTFREDVDPGDAASFVVTVLTGASTQRVTAGRPVECSRRMLREYVESHLLADAEALSA
ncbi:TetR/AcrR family transcriptional regulator [Haloarcula onubensis]|uniref:TetR family transcriptional regulator n=1 Tax=Haloarcula onubensis TaxID=2950539 RepID=A0ABU2FRE5_9EURY|nr:TetR/AcrR family transcriptional regulator [Halomicroarcula sp. S3CR25-11]MDS0282821.1 TetR family transcriptional regulator [Halomicroarcula sp. S3CR25-11]